MTGVELQEHPAGERGVPVDIRVLWVGGPHPHPRGAEGVDGAGRAVEREKLEAFAASFHQLCEAAAVAVRVRRADQLDEAAASEEEARLDHAGGLVLVPEGQPQAQPLVRGHGLRNVPHVYEGALVGDDAGDSRRVRHLASLVPPRCAGGLLDQLHEDAVRGLGVDQRVRGVGLEHVHAVPLHHGHRCRQVLALEGHQHHARASLVEVRPERAAGPRGRGNLYVAAVWQVEEGQPLAPLFVHTGLARARREKLRVGCNAGVKVLQRNHYVVETVDTR
eukprot:CAMPEP_0204516634 /NCGR_PEP_ID=MMETSP0661-20131031/3247_1 /ASSEMBLY_ACC=CAM_ASM_000606 /TAXON_ID=109239 /ORGANISM="Alexandrium margalefi, Strain AMGDE01CS-322" /LENGTH=276 /DNA_ID=CAMNT_0051521999 /DNA_START=117 /DNA_END=942 /DNA_ORIENTATION=+